MSSLKEIFESLKNDGELNKLAEVQGVPMPAEGGNGGAGVDAQVASAQGDQATAGHMVTDAVVNKVDGNASAKVEAAKDQIMEAAAVQNQAVSMAETDEVPGAHQQPILGEMLSIGEGTGEKMAAARIEHLVTLGLEKEAELTNMKLAEDNYVLGQIFGRGFNDLLAGKAPAFKKEASVLDTLGQFTEAELDAALNALDEKEMDKIASLLEEKGEFDKLAAQWYELGRTFGMGHAEATKTETTKATVKTAASAARTAIKDAVKK